MGNVLLISLALYSDLNELGKLFPPQNSKNVMTVSDRLKQSTRLNNHLNSDYSLSNLKIINKMFSNDAHNDAELRNNNFLCTTN